MSYQTKQSIVSLLQAAWQQISQLEWTEAKADTLQDQFDTLLAAVQDKMKDVTPPAEITSVDKGRKERREKEKKDKKDKKDVPTDPTAEPVKATRRKKDST